MRNIILKVKYCTSNLIVYMLVVVYFVSDFENEYMTMEIKNKTKNNLTLNKPEHVHIHVNNVLMAELDRYPPPL